MARRRRPSDGGRRRASRGWRRGPNDGGGGRPSGGGGVRPGGQGRRWCPAGGQGGGRPAGGQGRNAGGRRVGRWRCAGERRRGEDRVRHVAPGVHEELVVGEEVEPSHGDNILVGGEPLAQWRGAVLAAQAAILALLQ
uniref:Uncharacterized protein n=1 Tax=Setaria viridis TaxID=4556 RepID=A0A4U6TMG9_SETVI|nr:hypothetical protein SEVIR_8G246600v2 [Setaria viridis]